MVRLNAPFGARCFLTNAFNLRNDTYFESLNAPFGARCFLTYTAGCSFIRKTDVLMHLLALAAF